MLRAVNTRSLFKFFSLIFAIISLPLSLYLLDQKTSFLGRAYNSLTGTNANLVIDLATSSELTPNWKYLSQGGEESTGMLLDVVPKIKKLNPSYIRIDHIYDFYKCVLRLPNGTLGFDWTKLDSQLKTISDSGAKPFISLSYMPEVLSTGSETDIPKNWNEWRYVVQKTIEHVSGKNDLAISGVYYEVWNEPDLFGKFTIGNKKDYLNLYYYAAKGAEDAKNILPYKIGGPATTALYKNWLTKFLDYADKNNLRVDFYSWHKYALDVEEFDNDYQNFSQWISDYPKYRNIEPIITESGFTPEVDFRYDTNFAAIHTLSMYSALIGKIPKIFTFEIQDGPGPTKLWGRWGLLTHSKFGAPEEKPRFNAIEFLNRMTGNSIKVDGQGSWIKAFAVKSSDSNMYKIMLVNYDMFNKHSEEVPVTLLNLPFNTFNFKRINFMGGTSTEKINIEGAGWSARINMSPNSAAILEITQLSL